jgi:hypothetical protein
LQENGFKVPLAIGSPAATQYDSLRQQLLAANHIGSATCSAFFNADPTRASFYSQLSNTVTQQLAFDGPQSTISRYDAGMITPVDRNNAFVVGQLRGSPVCGDFTAYRNRHGTQSPRGKVTASSQIYSVGGQATDVYLNTNPKVLPSLEQSTILHESLHNLTGRYDFDERGQLGLMTFMGLTDSIECPSGTTVCISRKLTQVFCAGNN